MAQLYGWTLGEIDTLGDVGRERVRFMWAVSTLYQQAERYLDQWCKGQGNTQRSVEVLQAAARAGER